MQNMVSQIPEIVWRYSRISAPENGQAVSFPPYPVDILLFPDFPLIGISFAVGKEL
jgi:hypothetical protein